MSTLIGIIFEHDHDGASTALHRLRSLTREYAIELEDAVIATRDEDGKIKLQQSIHLTGELAWQGAFWGSLIGLIFTGPIGWILIGAAGAGFGALIGSTTDYGIEDDFIKQLSSDMEPCCSALFLLIRTMTEDKVLAQLEGLGGTVLKTSLSDDAEHRLQAALLKNATPSGMDGSQ